MKYLQLVWAALMRHKARTLFTLLSVAAAFLVRASVVMMFSPLLVMSGS